MTEDKKEPVQKVTFKREEGNLVRMVEVTDVPFILKQGEDPMAMSTDTANQVFNEEGEKKYRTFLNEQLEFMTKRLKSGEEELAKLAYLGHGELTDKGIQAFAQAIGELKKDDRKTKFHVDNMEKLCQVLFKKVKLKYELKDIEKRLAIAKAEKAELDKLDAK